jgi:hypothetical protein
MLQISFRPKQGKLDQPWSDVVVEGEVLQKSRALHLADGRTYAVVGDADSSCRLSCHSIADLRNYFWSLEIELLSPIPEFSLNAHMFFQGERDEDVDNVLRLTYRLSVQDWAGPWSIGAYNSAIREAMQLHQQNSITIHLTSEEQSEDGAWVFTQKLINPSNSLDEELDALVQMTSSLIKTAHVALNAEIDRNTLVTLFDFPKDVSTACEQYLLYFVQFLRDLGIEAGASIKHDARQVLFSVTPSDGAEALDRIREALDLYLRLPDSPEFAAQASGYGDIAVQQLQANIFHLKGQLAVAGAVLQARNAQIEALQLSNFTYQQMLATEQQAASIPLLPASTAKSDAEPLVPGIITVIPYEGKGFTVNLPELLRRLKRRFDQG